MSATATSEQPMNRNRCAIWALALATVGSLALSQVASAHIYWADQIAGTIGRANLDGTGVNPRFITGASAPVDLAVDSSHVYWANLETGTIGRANLDGSGVNQRFITVPSESGSGEPEGAAPLSLAVGPAHIYWGNGDLGFFSDTNVGAVGRANLDGSGVNPSFIAGAPDSFGVAVDGSHVYWTNRQAAAIGRANLDGSAANQGFISAPDVPLELGLSSSHVYWVQGQWVRAEKDIGRANLDGSGVDLSFISHLTHDDEGFSGFFHGFAVHGGHLYLGESQTISRASLDGTGLDVAFVRRTGFARGVAVDDRGPGAGQSSQSLKIGGDKRLRVNRRGVVRLRLRCREAQASAPCRGGARLRTRGRVRLGGKRRRVVLDRARLRVPAGEATRVRMRLATPKLRLVRRQRTARRAVAIVRVRDAAGDPVTVRKRIRLVPQR